MRSFLLAILLGTAVYQTAVQTNFIGNLVETEEVVYNSPVTDTDRESFYTGYTD